MHKRLEKRTVPAADAIAAVALELLAEFSVVAGRSAPQTARPTEEAGCPRRDGGASGGAMRVLRRLERGRGVVAVREEESREAAGGALKLLGAEGADGAEQRAALVG